MSITTDLTKTMSAGDATDVRNVVNGFCAVQSITPDLLALILELNSEVYTPFINGYFVNDGRTMDMFMRLFWIVGLNEADPSRFGVHSVEVNQWAVEHIEMIAGKRRELLRVAQEVKTEAARRKKAERVAHALKEYTEMWISCAVLWAVALITVLLWLLFHGAVFAVFCGFSVFFGIFMAMGTLISYIELKSAERS